MTASISPHRRMVMGPSVWPPRAWRRPPTSYRWRSAWCRSLQATTTCACWQTGARSTPWGPESRASWGASQSASQYEGAGKESVRSCSDFKCIFTGAQTYRKAKTLNEKTGNCTLILYKTNGQRAVLNAYYAPFPLSTWDAYLLWSYHQFGGQSQCCLFCFFVYSYSHPYKSINKPNLSWTSLRYLFKIIKLALSLILAMNPGVPSQYLSSLFNLSDENPGLTFSVRFPVLLFYCLCRKASFRGAPSAHPDWIVPSVDKEVEMKFQFSMDHLNIY